MKDLFGNEVADLSDEIDYKSYINSKKWKKIRARKLEQAGYICERCGISKYSAKLEVHHKHYFRLGNENLNDLIVLCPKCHEVADQEREIQTAQINERKRTDGALSAIYDTNSKLYAGFVGWLDSRYPLGWAHFNQLKLNQDYKSFLKWIKVL